MYFICLSVWRWNDVNSFVSIPNILFNSFVISVTNCNPLSNTILSSNPCNFYMLSLNYLANHSTDVPSLVTTKCVILDSLLQTTRITSFLATNSNFIIKFTIRCIHSFFRTLLNFNFSASTSTLFSNIYHILSYIVMMHMRTNIFLLSIFWI